jgi:hypothetical protein
MPRPKKPSRDLVDCPPVVHRFRFDTDNRDELIRLAKLEGDKARSESFVRDVEEAVHGYKLSMERSKKRPSPASQRAVLLEVRKHAARLQGLLARMDPDTKETYCRSVPFPCEGVWMDHRMTIEHIIHTTERAERRLSEDVRPGKMKRTDLEDLFPSLWFCTRKYLPSLTQGTFSEIAHIVCKASKIRIPDIDDSPNHFEALVNPPFPPKAPLKRPRTNKR